ncbi:MAG: hypothetical protein PHW11_03975 [Anaerolineaceae bacterium]|jgi:hypothetical protein|nr:hypothetical protein [Anaerolineaceae bacterium]MDD4042649.1 hypothetical protein [Anaerolineaceae bacterium]MDD4578862.1 hypothetical protein [Anaerolineaceae bacterium]
MRNQNKQYDDDDGRTIVDMDVDGMPWHDRNVRFAEKQARDFDRKQKAEMYGERMTNSEARRYTFYALLAGLALTAALAVVWIVLVLFMTQVWFR